MGVFSTARESHLKCNSTKESECKNVSKTGDSLQIHEYSEDFAQIHEYKKDSASAKLEEVAKTPKRKTARKSTK